MRMMHTYAEVQKKYGSHYQIELAIKRGELFRVSRGIYSDKRNVNPYMTISMRYPHAILTMDSAFYIHGLTDVIPQKTYLATRRNATRISDIRIKQIFIEDRFFEAGYQTLEYEGAVIRIYSKERMLIELMRNSKSLPLDYYKEVISNYRKAIDSLDMRAIEEYMELFDRNEYLFNILQREVL